MDNQEKAFVVGFVAATIIWGIAIIIFLASINKKLESLIQ